MSLLAFGGEDYATGLGTPVYPSPVSVPNDLSNLQRLRSEPVQEDRTGARNQGEFRSKHAMHLLRLLITGAATLRQERVPVRVEHHRDRLLAIKTGSVRWAEVNAWRRELHHDFENALSETKLPERPDYEKANEFLLKARRQTAAAL